jgi:alpha-L-fucosidase 2
MVFGGIGEEHLQLNEETLYAGKRMDRVNPMSRANVPVIRQLLLDGKVKEAEALAQKTLLAIPVRQPPYQTLGDLRIAFDVADTGKNYRRTLDLYDGIVTTTFDHATREAFASYPDGVIVVHLKASGPFTVALTREAAATSISNDMLVMRGTALPDGAAFTVAVRVLSNGKIAAGANNTLHITNATEATLLFAAATDVRAPNPDSQCFHQLQTAAVHSYAELRARHLVDFRALSTRVSFSLGRDAETQSTPTDELLQQTGNDDRALVPLYFAYGRYLLQSSSRQNSLAANLQGKWNDKLDPSWGSKYTININTEMNYWPAEVTNLGETVDGLYNLLAGMQDNGRRDAKEIYGTAGFVAHHNTDVWGDVEPIDGVPSGIWPFGAAWLSLSLWEHYAYSGDLSYLREKAYPLMSDAALFLLENLFPDGHGHLVSGPSLSPENRYFTPDHQRASLDLSPTMDVEITTALFRRVIEASKLLQTDDKLRQRLSDALPKLMPLQIGRFGQLQEWRSDYEEVEPGHRHLSHLFAVYPSDEINPATPDLYRAARASLERRLANGGGGTGWSRAWVVCLWASFHEGDKADDSLRVLFSKSTWPNLFDLHPPEIFQIDGNLGATAGIVQMLLQSHEGNVELLPALPATWPEGHITGLRARDGLTVDLDWKDSRIRSAKLHAAHAVKFNLQANGKAQALELGTGETRSLQFN